ncbi:MAG: VOC family protein [Candidatus Dormibacteraeota bacterium]|nr:VOC family protein [Candidatus Dormibacteraeota bacterium]
MDETTATYPTVCPYLVVPDADQVIAFLKGAFGAEQMQLHRAEDGRVRHAELRLGTSVVMVGTSTPSRQASLYLRVEDVDAAYARALSNGGIAEREPGNQDYGDRSAGVVDPGGNIWWLAGPLR